ncbi:hypothetical protein HIM_06690 [Hirsutella minnesotensis 3608]|uniref:poly(ADP-ribose) glycohydrolase n=1 Tax=Hirsutella minnesotensis 3608 TaxID=1043627 RepID=A0A0F7ZZD3_9HYPO|nr:hypothetical protein HIM_06690 [Hirsutella minnesotensis 3608]
MPTGRPVFVLPSSNTQRCLDRFSILDDLEEDSSGLVPFWSLLIEILKQKVDEASHLVDVLDTISNSLRGSSAASGDYGTLKAMVQNKNHKFFSHLWPRIVWLALQMPELFPEGCMSVLQPGQSIRLTRRQAGCLVAHQFLCTLQPPSWRQDFFDFSIWYDSSQRHPKAVEMYLTALFIYAQRFDENDNMGAVEYSLHSSGHSTKPMPQDWETVTLSPISVTKLQTCSTEQQEPDYQGPDGAVIVSANKDIGFGESATQEELFVGNCPEACPAVLVTPTMADDQALVINGATPMLRIQGQGRDIFWWVLDPAAIKGSGGRMLFMDALEIDEEACDDTQGLPDLKPENRHREIVKAYTTLSSWDAGARVTVWTGLWGCGAFNGDPGVKMTLLWMAASLADKELCILCEPSRVDFATQFGAFIRQMLALPSGATVGDLGDRLDRIPPTTRRLDTARWLLMPP